MSVRMYVMYVLLLVCMLVVFFAYKKLSIYLKAFLYYIAVYYSLIVQFSPSILFLSHLLLFFTTLLIYSLPFLSVAIRACRSDYKSNLTIEIEG